MIKQFNDVSSWVTKCIVTVVKKEQRVVLLKRFINLMESLRSLNNFNGMMEILSGVNRFFFLLFFFYLFFFYLFYFIILFYYFILFISFLIYSFFFSFRFFLFYLTEIFWILFFFFFSFFFKNSAPVRRMKATFSGLGEEYSSRLGAIEGVLSPQFSYRFLSFLSLSLLFLSFCSLSLFSILAKIKETIFFFKSNLKLIQ